MSKWNIFFTVSLIWIFLQIAAQDQGVLIQFDSQDKGILIPRMGSNQWVSISNPAEGLMLYDSTQHMFMYFNGTSWQSFNSGPIGPEGVGITNITAQDIGGGMLEICIDLSNGMTKKLTTPDLTGPPGPQGDPGVGIPQLISRSGTSVTLSDGGGTVSIADNDNNSNNEIQTIDNFNLNGSTLELSLSDDGMPDHTVDLSSIGGSGGVPMTGIIRSKIEHNPILESNGFTMIGRETVNIDSYGQFGFGWADTVSLAGAAGVRFDHVAFWTGSEMIVWGGGGVGNVPTNTGGLYNPTTDSWRPMSTGANVPEARGLYFGNNEYAVWTGTEMIVWGGLTRFSSHKEGAHYNPITDTWTAMDTSDVNIPDQRQFHSLIWTGTEMIVWGGYEISVFVNTGSRYNPTTGIWTPTSTGPGVPAPRGDHSAVWTGTEMIVWGGDTSAVSANTGGRYNPSSDTWTPTSTGVNVPVPRPRHSAIWTGTDMIIWGGFKNGFPLFTFYQSGGIYNPSSDTWTSTSEGINVPSPRMRHTAVWTGEEMIIWGGEGPEVTNTGGIYDPISNTWESTSLSAPVPEARTGHTGIWTGADMIVWGGQNPMNISPFNNGGIFNKSVFQYQNENITFYLYEKQ